MNQRLLLQATDLPPICEREVLRYMGVTTPTKALQALLREVLAEGEGLFSYRVVYKRFCLGEMTERGIDLGFAVTTSRSLTSYLSGCREILLFAATVGLEIDRAVAKYSRISPSRALCLQALGAERIEALCDTFCNRMQLEYSPCAVLKTARFSPGYGDLSLDLQRDIFHALNCPVEIGLTLNSALLMTPTKSVTAIVGIKEREGYEF